MLGVVSYFLLRPVETEKDIEANDTKQEANKNIISQPIEKPTLAKIEPLAALPVNPQVAQGRIALRGNWGAEQGQFGRLPANESNPEMPMAIHVTPNNELVVLDQVNRRLQRFDSNGRPLSSTSIATTTASDVIVDKDGRALVLERYTASGIEMISADGKTSTKINIKPGLFNEPSAMTAMFTTSDGIYVENDRDSLVRVAAADGQPTSENKKLNGRPTRDGSQLIKAGIIEAKAGTVYVQAHSFSGQLNWETSLKLPRPLLFILMLDSDFTGNIYLGVEIAEENAQTKELVNVNTAVLRISKEGKPNGSILLPATRQAADDTFHPLTVGNDGTIYQMVPTAAGLQVNSYAFEAN